MEVSHRNVSTVITQLEFNSVTWAKTACKGLYLIILLCFRITFIRSLDNRSVQLPYLVHVTALPQFSLLLASTGVLFPAKMEAPSRVCAHP